jgi:hypothetical protein
VTQVLTLAIDLNRNFMSCGDADSQAALVWSIPSDCRQRTLPLICKCLFRLPRASSVYCLERKLYGTGRITVWVVGGAIGQCIHTDPRQVTHGHRVEMSEEFNALEKMVRDERLFRASGLISKAYDGYRCSLVKLCHATAS